MLARDESRELTKKSSRFRVEQAAMIYTVDLFSRYVVHLVTPRCNWTCWICACSSADGYSCNSRINTHQLFDFSSDKISTGIFGFNASKSAIIIGNTVGALLIWTAARWEVSPLCSATSTIQQKDYSKSF